MSAPATLEAALTERDLALADLATARAENEALRALLLSLGEPQPANYPATAAVGEPPLRYAVIDALHSRATPLFAAGRLMFSALRRKTK
ncbi:MAG: hypothetical protein ACO1OB_09160 [Archangium sp.]